jgi:hypothetical protein
VNRKPSGDVDSRVGTTRRLPKLPEGYRLDLVSDPEAPALRGPDGVIVARFSAGGMTGETIAHEALEDLLYRSEGPLPGRNPVTCPLPT